MRSKIPTPEKAILPVTPPTSAPEVVNKLTVSVTLRVHVPNNGVLGIWRIVVVVQVCIIGYLDPEGLESCVKTCKPGAWNCIKVFTTVPNLLVCAPTTLLPLLKLHSNTGHLLTPRPLNVQALNPVSSRWLCINHGYYQDLQIPIKVALTPPKIGIWASSAVI